MPCPPPGDFSIPGVEPRSPTLQADSLLSEPSGKLKDTGVGSHSLLQGNLPNSANEPRFPVFQADSLPSEPPGKSQELIYINQLEQSLAHSNYSNNIAILLSKSAGGKVIRIFKKRQKSEG